MRSRTLVALLVAGLAATAWGCAGRTQPYRFSMPMLGHADVPPSTVRRTEVVSRDSASSTRPRSGRGRALGESGTKARPVYAYGWQRDAQAGIRVVSARGIELQQPTASAAAADAVVADSERAARSIWMRLPARHLTKPSGLTDAIELPAMAPIREPASLRALVGLRDKRDPNEIAMGWLADLGITFVAEAALLDMAAAAASRPTDGLSLVAWADAHGKLRAPTDTILPGDALVFDRARGDAPADLIGVVIACDARGVIEFVYAGGGVIRHGFVDASRPTTRRDLTGAIVNTFLRHARRWPPKGTRYFAGELLRHVIRTR